MSGWQGVGVYPNSQGNVTAPVSREKGLAAPSVRSDDIARVSGLPSDSVADRTADDLPYTLTLFVLSVVIVAAAATGVPVVSVSRRRSWCDG